MDPRRLRASDADRERVAAVLHAAMAEGRLTLSEVDERLTQVYAARTLGELQPITRDLPGQAVVLPEPEIPAVYPAAGAPVPSPRIGGTPGSTMAIAVMSGSVRKGGWVVPGQFTAIAVMGGVELDLTQARFAAPEVTINAFALMGGVDITVPEGVTVIVNGFALMGGFDDRVQQQAPPGSPVLRVNGFALMGGVDVKRPKGSRRQLDR